MARDSDVASLPGVVGARAGAVIGACVVAVTVGAAWLGFGVSASDALRYAMYEAAFVALPGVLAYLVLAPRPGAVIRWLAIGVPLGLALELAAFNLTAALEFREAFAIYPALAIPVFGVLAWRRPPISVAPGSRLGRGSTIALGVAIAAGVAYFALGGFVPTPLPAEAENVAYHPDVMAHVSIAAEALHHWPVENPGVVGLDLRYHFFAHQHMAAATQVTAVELLEILVRLLPVFIIVVIGVQVGALARTLGGPPWTAPVAAGLMLAAGELDLDPDREVTFLGAFFKQVFISPTFLFGFVFLLGATILIAELLKSRPGERERGTYVLLGILLLTAAGAKAAILPVLLGGLALLVVVRALTARRLVGEAARLLALTTGAFLVSYVALYAGGGDRALEFAPLSGLAKSTIHEFIGSPTDSISNLVAWGPGIVLLVVAFLAPLMGIVWLIAERRGRLDDAEWFVVFAFVFGSALTLSFEHPGNANFFFMFYGYAAALPLGARGLASIVERLRGPERVDPLRYVLVAAGGLFAVLVASTIAWSLPLSDPQRYVLAFGSVGFAVLAAGLVGARGHRGRERGLRATGIAALALAGASMVDPALDLARGPVERALAGDSIYEFKDSSADHGMDTALYDGLRWVRAHTDEDDVIAVNHHYSLSGERLPTFFYYTALTERRAYIESWLFTPKGLGTAYEDLVTGRVVPYADRVELNDTAFESPSAAAISRLGDQGVDYMLVDNYNREPGPRLDRWARQVFTNPSLTVYELDE